MQNFWNRRRKRRSKKKQEHNEGLILDKIIRDIRTLFEQEEEDYYKVKRVSRFWNNNYSEYASNNDKNKNLSLDEYLKKIKTCLRNIIFDLQSSDTWKIQLIIAINFIFSKDTEQERVMYSVSDNIKFTSYNEANENVNELLESLL